VLEYGAKLESLCRCYAGGEECGGRDCVRLEGERSAGDPREELAVSWRRKSASSSRSQQMKVWLSLMVLTRSCMRSVDEAGAAVPDSVQERSAMGLAGAAGAADA
jgi:hypothetical protein